MSEQHLTHDTRPSADGGAGRTTVLCLPLIVAALVAGWYAVRRNPAGTAAGAGKADA